MARSADPVLAQRRRRQILDAAISCFRRRGFHQTSMQEICAEAQLSAGALYRYFPAKADIIAAIAEEDWVGKEALFNAIARGPDVIGALCVLAEHALEQCGGESSLAADVIAEVMRDQSLSLRFVAHDAHVRRRLALSLASAQRRGHVAFTLTPDRAAGVVILMLDGLVVRAAGLGAARARPLVEDFRAALELIFTPLRPHGLRTAHPVTQETDA
ncbi:MAG: helix-turn-helix domain-containing protein [Hyphomonadaceae bacterium]|nr:helix-turn-helix domain-containing protein [Hyphomonadaceae bacterium]